MSATGAAAAAAAPAIAAAQGRVAASEGSGSVFPARTLVLTVPGRSSVPSSDVHIVENGRSVRGAIVTPISNAKVGDFGIVLAIDVSPSMRGRSLADAMSAARSMAQRRVGQQLLGVVEFDQKATAVLPLTANASAIDRVLAHTPPVGPGTHIFDALALSVRELQAAHVAAGAVILLSDGADRGSAQSEQAVAAAARAAHVSLYTVGIRNGAFDPKSLSMLARDGGGQFLATDSSGLRDVFTRLEAGLASRYVVHYRSDQPAGHEVRLRLKVTGVPGEASLGYFSPAPPHAAGTRGHRSKSFWVSTLALLAFSLGAALIVALGLVAFLRPRVRRDRLRDRVGDFTSTMALPSLPSAEQPQRRFAGLERVLEHARWWEQFKLDVEIARFERSAVELVASCVAGTVALAVLFGVVVKSPVLAIFTLLFGPLVLRLSVQNKLRKQRELFAAQLPNHVQEVASTMRAGHSLVSGITTMADAASEPSRSEWGRVVGDEQLGMPLEDALRPLGERMDCSDIEQIALVAALQSRSGGNMADVLERVADGVRERTDLRRELHSLTAQARLSRWIISGLPPAMVVVLELVHPGYLRPLTDTTGGQLLLGLAVLLVVIGSLVMRAITTIRV